MKPQTKKRLLIATSVTAAIYLLSYAALAYGGGYLFVRSGHFRPLNGLAMMDTLVWQPRVGIFFPFRTISGKDTYQKDFIGALYSPLILFQQMTVTPSIRTVEPDGSRSTLRQTLPTRQKLHPSTQQELPEMEHSLGITWEQLAEKFAAGR